jgi:hypothetical protein
MGWMVAISACYGCGRAFSYNPDLVPSVVVDGVRKSICPNCVEEANPRRIANGLEPIVPLPGAYEPMEAD